MPDLLEINICCQPKAFWKQRTRVQPITLKPKKSAQILPPFLYFSRLISCSEHANAETQECPFNCGVLIALTFFDSVAIMSWSHFLPSPALQQPYVPSPLHNEHNFEHACLYNHTFSKISVSTCFTSIFLFSLSWVYSVDFVTRLQQLSALQYFGTELKAYRLVS